MDDFAVELTVNGDFRDVPSEKIKIHNPKFAGAIPNLNCILIADCDSCLDFNRTMFDAYLTSPVRGSIFFFNIDSATSIVTAEYLEKISEARSRAQIIANRLSNINITQ